MIENGTISSLTSSFIKKNNICLSHILETLQSPTKIAQNLRHIWKIQTLFGCTVWCRQKYVQYKKQVQDGNKLKIRPVGPS